MSYTIEEHKHRFAAWAAGRAASVKGCRFSVEQAIKLLKTAGLHNHLADPNKLPSPEEMDNRHREWRSTIIDSAKHDGLELTHGVAAKLINVYMKSAFVCSGEHNHPRVQALHPPIDALLLNGLAKKEDNEERRKIWNEARRIRWSKFNSQQYDTVIYNIRASMQGQAMWMVEQYWRGFQ